ncbi:MAG: DUF1614 domain-containing protein [Methylovirgula sp.]
MHMDHLQYLPLTLPFFGALVAVFLLLVGLIEVGVLRYAFMSLGISARAAMLLLLASLIGSYINIPIAELPARQALADQTLTYFGMRYSMPVVVEWPGTIVAINVGGALIPFCLSIYLLAKNDIWIRGIIATACVAAIVHALAYPVHGIGIAVPTFVPPIATAIIAFIISREYAAPIAYVAGSMGTMIGADLLNLDKVQSLGAPVASIGGAGTFDGIFLTGILAVLLAAITQPTLRPGPAH